MGNPPFKGEYSTHRSALYRILLKTDNQAIRFILKSRATIKKNGQIGFYPLPAHCFADYNIEKYLDRGTCSWVLTGAETYRLSSRKLLSRWGTNLQTQQDSMRVIYSPDAGKLFVQLAQAGAEALIVAFLCRLGKFRRLFLNKIKSHIYVAKTSDQARSARG